MKNIKTYEQHITKLNKNDLIHMDIKEIQTALSRTLKMDPTEVLGHARLKMIEYIKTLFDDSVRMEIEYTSNKCYIDTAGLIIHCDRLDFHLVFKYKKPFEHTSDGKVLVNCNTKVDRLMVNFYNPYFESVDLKSYTVIPKGEYFQGATADLAKRKEKVINMLTKEILTQELQNHKDWKDVKKTLISNAAQPQIKSEIRNPNFGPEMIVEIKKKIAEVNAELLENVYNKMMIVVNLD